MGICAAGLQQILKIIFEFLKGLLGSEATHSKQLTIYIFTG
jgi:hypothetical protein